MYRSGLVPQKLAMLGLVGGAFNILSGTLVMFGVADAGGTLQGLATIPEGLWERRRASGLLPRSCELTLVAIERLQCPPHRPRRADQAEGDGSASAPSAEAGGSSCKG
jgi:hypothetical protein